MHYRRTMAAERILVTEFEQKISIREVKLTPDLIEIKTKIEVYTGVGWDVLFTWSAANDGWQWTIEPRSFWVHSCPYQNTLHAAFELLAVYVADYMIEKGISIEEALSLKPPTLQEKGRSMLAGIRDSKLPYWIEQTDKDKIEILDYLLSKGFVIGKYYPSIPTMLPVSTNYPGGYDVHITKYGESHLLFHGINVKEEK